MKNVWKWICDKFGRLSASLGGVLMTLDAIDLNPARPFLVDYFGDKAAGRIIAGAAAFFFLLSYIRHQIVANRHPIVAVLPPPAAGTTRNADEVTIKTLIFFLALSAIATVTIAYAAPPVEVPIEKDAPKLEGHPLTSIVITQCHLIVAVYMTMPDGRLLRFDKVTSIPSDQLMTMAYSALRSERVEVSCNETGAVGYERHDPV